MSKTYIKSFDLSSVEVDLATINVTKRKHLQKLKGNNQKISYLAWMMLKEIIFEEYNLNIDELELSYNEFGKPHFKEFEFNISHYNNVVAIIISNRTVGIDILKVIEDISLFSKKLDLPLDKYVVTKHLSAVEAYYKMLGTGIKKSSLKEKVTISKQEIIMIDNNEYVLSICEQ